VALAGSLTAIRPLAGDISPSVALGGSLAAVRALAGDLSPSVAFAGSLTGVKSFSGDLAPNVALAGSITTAAGKLLSGNLVPTVAFAGELSVPGQINLSGDIPVGLSFAGALTAHPLWQDPCTIRVGTAYGRLEYGLDGYAETPNNDPCCEPPSMWTPEAPCTFDNAFGSQYGKLLYGRNSYSSRATAGWGPASETSATVTWKEEEPCSG
jgi:hypothetical protein